MMLDKNNKMNVVMYLRLQAHELGEDEALSKVFQVDLTTIMVTV